MEHRILTLIVILGAKIFDFGLGEVQLGLRELDDGGKAEIVAALGEVEGQTGLAQELRGNVHALKAVVELAQATRTSRAMRSC